MYCLRVFIDKNYNVYLIIYLCSLKSMGILSFVLIDCWVSELYPYRMYGLRLFIVVLHELQCLPTN